jgi:Asp-tRNA(Asn)/Glu-tRNA(Gln) amidotransferase A subunit family amidase
MVDLRYAGPAGLNLLLVTEAAAKIAGGEITSEELVTGCLDRIEARDQDIHAWKYIDRDYALEQARACDRTAVPTGPLHGVPVGVKDVLDTYDMPTEYGSSIYKGNRPAKDSVCVAALRQAGAVILGKTTTTEFASPVPVGVRNPHDFTRTAGVSSSGSAAAVADFMTPLANGTQTGGSVIVPAAYCGVVGYKASLDGLDRAGIRNLKPTLDTLGYFARSVEDIGLVYGALSGDVVPEAISMPRIGLCRTMHWDEAEPASQAVVEETVQKLSKAGLAVTDIDLPDVFGGIDRIFRIISNVEGIRGMEAEFRDHLDKMNYWLRDMAASKDIWSDEDYREALAAGKDARNALGRIFKDVDILLAPSIVGEAPADLESLSVSPFNRIWTLMHGPTMTLPSGEGSNGMPIGVQLIALQGDDARLIAWARQISTLLMVERA